MCLSILHESVDQCFCVTDSFFINELSLWSIRLHSEESFSSSCAGNDRSINAVHLLNATAAARGLMFCALSSSLWPRSKQTIFVALFQYLVFLGWVKALKVIRSYVCVCWQVLSPRPIPADDAVLRSRRFESSAHNSGHVEAAHSGRRCLRGNPSATGQSTESVWAWII